MSDSSKAKLYIGTSGWSYPDWQGVVYPKGKKVDELQFMAKFFNAVELNTTFYHPPTPQMTASWVRRTADAGDFHFTVKLWQRFTHERAVAHTPEEVELFRRGIDPLAISGRLGGILIQFPWSFANSELARELIVRLCKDFADYPRWIEVRHRSWDTPDTYKLLRELHAGFANIDQPTSSRSITPSATLTTDTAYVRFHGRNAKAWFDHDSGVNERYNYLYSESELNGWVENIERLRRTAVAVYAFFNNHYRGQAPANALQLASRLKGLKVPVPKDLLETYPMLRDVARHDADRTGELF